MASINKVIIVGNLGQDPIMRYTTNNEPMCNITVATSDRWKDRITGEPREATEWHRITFFGKLAEIADKNLRKGSQVYIEGRLRTRKYTDRDGIEKYSTDIIADQMQMLGRREQSSSSEPFDTAPRSAAPAAERAASRPTPAPMSMDDDDIPF